MTLGKATRVGWIGIALAVAACHPPPRIDSDTPVQDPADDTDAVHETDETDQTDETDETDPEPPADVDEDGWTEADGDCNDHDSSIHPTAPEECNRRDDDCDGLIDREDPDLPAELLLDADGDGYFAPACGDDCNDADASIHPGAADAECDGIDSACDDWGREVAVVDGETVGTVAEAFALIGPGGEILLCPGRHSVGSLTVTAFDGAIRAWSGSSEDTELVSGTLSGDGDLAIGDLSFDTVHFQWEGPLTAERSTFRSSGIHVEYAGTALVEPGVVVRNSTFSDMPFTGGACPIYAEITDGEILVEESELHDNETDGAFCSGSLSLWLSDATALVTASHFENNLNSGSGAAISVAAGTGTNALRVEDSTIQSNTSVVSSGALEAYVWGGAAFDLSVDSSTFADNTEGAMTAGASGSSTDLDVVITDTVFTGNLASYASAALDTYGIDDAAVELQILRSDFDGNTSWPQGSCSQIEVSGETVVVAIDDTTVHDSESWSWYGSGWPCTVGFFGSGMTISWSGGSVLRNQQYYEVSTGTGFEWTSDGWGAVFLGLDWGNTASFENVAFGTDADANQPRDIYECESNEHVGTITAFLDAANPCP